MSQLAAHARRLRVIAITDAGYLAQIHETTALAQSARSPDAVVDLVREQLGGLLDLADCRFEYGMLLTRRGWNETARCGRVMAAGTWRRRGCPPRGWSCGCSATASTTAGSC